MTKRQTKTHRDDVPFTLKPPTGNDEGKPSVGLIIAKDRTEDPEAAWMTRFPNEDLPDMLVTLHLKEVRPFRCHEDTRCVVQSCMTPAAMEYFLALLTADR